MWRCPEMGVPLFIIHFRLGFPFQTIHLLGFPHDQLETHLIISVRILVDLKGLQCTKDVFVSQT